VPDRPTFGFHGMFNMWRFLGDDDIEEIAENLDDRSARGSDFVECALAYWAQRRFAPLAALYGRWRKVMTVKQVHDLVQRVLGQAETTAAFIEVAEAPIKTPSYQRYAL
jgi:hypothetical protein